MDSRQKEALEKYSKNEEDRLFLAKVLDKANQADRGYLVYTHFMDPHQRSIAGKLLRELGCQSFFDGGYPEAERTLGIFVPDYMACQSEEETLSAIRGRPDYPLALVQVHYKKNSFAKELTHRDYLGAVMNLGVKRETVGDFLIHEGFAQILVLSDMASYLENNLRQVARVSVEAFAAPLRQLLIPVQKTMTKTAAVASLRLDAVVAEGFGIPRSQAQEYIGSGKVYLEFEECCTVSKPVEEGQTISLRGMGRVVLTQAGGSSRKKRIFVTLQKFV